MAPVPASSFPAPLKVAGVIPARYGSSRFPGKPLALLKGRAMILHVCDRAAETETLDAFWVATDDERIAEAVRAGGFEARMTPSDCPSGTDRIAASLKPGEDWNVLVNIQGDEPQLEASVIDSVTRALIEHPEAGVSTAAVAIHNHEDFLSPNLVKAVFAADGRALYFSRSPIPSEARWAPGDDPDAIWGYKHHGLYAYRREVLEAYAGWAPSPLEQRECLEQLRLMEHGVTIWIAVVEHGAIGVDTPEDLVALEAGPQ